MSETPCQPSQQENGHLVTDPADIATETATSNPEQDTTASKREEVSQFSPHARSAEGLGAMNSTETAPNATQSADSGAPAVTTLPEPTPVEKAVSVALKTRIAPNGEFIPFGMEWSEQKQAVVPVQLVVENPIYGANLDDADEMPVIMSQIGLPKHLPTATEALNQFAESWSPAIAKLDAKIDEEGPWGPFANDETRQKLHENGKRLAEQILRNKPATGIEAAVCADIAERQRRGIAKYGKTVMANDLPFLAWLTHFYEELLDAAVYARRIIHEHENQTQNHGGASGVLPSNPGTVRIPRKPGGGRKPLVCPSCGGVKTIGSSMKDGIPIKRCKVCGHVHKSYPHLANAAKAAT